MANATYNIGDLVRVTGTVAGTVNVDPGTVYGQYKTPAGSVTTYEYNVDAELVRSALGIYYFDVDLDTVGTWNYRFYSTGTGQAASDDNTIVVKASTFT